MLRQWIEKRRAEKKAEFAARLKYGKDWHYKLYPHKYTRSTGPK